MFGVKTPIVQLPPSPTPSPAPSFPSTSLPQIPSSSSLPLVSPLFSNTDKHSEIKIDTTTVQSNSTENNINIQSPVSTNIFFSETIDEDSSISPSTLTTNPEKIDILAIASKEFLSPSMEIETAIHIDSPYSTIGSSTSSNNDLISEKPFIENQDIYPKSMTNRQQKQSKNIKPKTSGFKKSKKLKHRTIGAPVDKNILSILRQQLLEKQKINDEKEDDITYSNMLKEESETYSEKSQSPHILPKSLNIDSLSEHTTVMEKEQESEVAVKSDLETENNIEDSQLKEKETLEQPPIELKEHPQKESDQQTDITKQKITIVNIKEAEKEDEEILRIPSETQIPIINQDKQLDSKRFRELVKTRPYEPLTTIDIDDVSDDSLSSPHLEETHQNKFDLPSLSPPTLKEVKTKKDITDEDLTITSSHRNIDSSDDDSLPEIDSSVKYSITKPSLSLNTIPYESPLSPTTNQSDNEMTFPKTTFPTSLPPLSPRSNESDQEKTFPKTISKTPPLSPRTNQPNNEETFLKTIVSSSSPVTNIPSITSTTPTLTPTIATGITSTIVTTTKTTTATNTTTSIKTDDKHGTLFSIHTGYNPSVYLSPPTSPPPTRPESDGSSSSSTLPAPETFRTKKSKTKSNFDEDKSKKSIPFSSGKLAKQQNILNKTIPSTDNLDKRSLPLSSTSTLKSELFNTYSPSETRLNKINDWTDNDDEPLHLNSSINIGIKHTEDKPTFSLGASKKVQRKKKEKT